MRHVQKSQIVAFDLSQSFNSNSNLSTTQVEGENIVDIDLSQSSNPNSNISTYKFRQRT